MTALSGNPQSIRVLVQFAATIPRLMQLGER